MDDKRLHCWPFFFALLIQIFISLRFANFYAKKFKEKYHKKKIARLIRTYVIFYRRYTNEAEDVIVIKNMMKINIVLKKERNVDFKLVV